MKTENWKHTTIAICVISTDQKLGYFYILNFDRIWYVFGVQNVDFPGNPGKFQDFENIPGSRDFPGSREMSRTNPEIPGFKKSIPKMNTNYKKDILLPHAPM